MKKLAVSVAGLLALTAPLAAPATASAGPPAPRVEQWRSYWVDAFNPGIYDQAQVSTLVADAKKVGANVLIVQTGRRFDCFCNNALYPRTDAAIAPAPYDPLAEIIRQGHAAGLQVHAWINATTLWNSATPPTSPKHAFNQHGPTAVGADRWLNKRVDGAELIGANAYVDPGNPAVVDYIADAVASVQRNYDIDGINLDYIRYPDYNTGEFSNDWGYTDVALRRFAAETGRSDRPAPDDATWSQWRRDQVSNLVRRVYLRMYAQDPRDRLSINGITYAYGPSYYGGFTKTRPYLNVLQDYAAWMREGYLDTVTAMNYKRNWKPDQAQMFSTWNDGLRAIGGETGRYVVSGPALYLNSVEDSVAQAAEVTRGGMGWSGYAYANPSQEATASSERAVKDAQRDALAAALTGAVFTAPAAVPRQPWKATTGVLAGVVTVGGRPGDQVGVTVRRLGLGLWRAPGAAAAGDSRRLVSDGSGWYGAASLTPGLYKVQVDEPGVKTRTFVTWVGAGHLTRLDLPVR